MSLPFSAPKVIDASAVRVKLRLPVPPSANVYWRKYCNRMVRSSEAEVFIASVALLAGKLRTHGWPTTLPVSLSFVWYRGKAAGDLDNRNKALLDALQGIVYYNDRQVREMHAKLDDTDKGRPRMEVTVKAMG